MRLNEYAGNLLHQATAYDTSWWLVAAEQAFRAGNYTIIHGRKEDHIYMARFWLTPPVAEEDGALRSEKSILLHNILMPDDDDALHDHPWDFSTTILSGGYDEEIPSPTEWHTCYGGPQLGPEKTINREFYVGDQSSLKEVGLHRIATVLPNTWTLVNTGFRNRTWGFHPAGKKWVDYRTHLSLNGVIE